MRDKINCTTHGLRRPAFICQHLNMEQKVGFHEAFESSEKNDYPNGELNAWCDECNSMLEKSGHWTTESEEFAKVKMCCDKCFFDMKNLHRTKKSWLHWFKK